MFTTVSLINASVFLAILFASRFEIRDTKEGRDRHCREQNQHRVERMAISQRSVRDVVNDRKNNGSNGDGKRQRMAAAIKKENSPECAQQEQAVRQKEI